MDLNRNSYVNRLKGVGIALLLFTLAFGGSIQAQDTLVQPMPIHLLDTLNFKVRDTGLIKNILRPLRFRDNRNRRERERAYRYMQQLIEDGELKVDTTNVAEVMEVLAQLQDSLNNGNVQGHLGISLDSIENESDEVEKTPLTDKEPLEKEYNYLALIAIVLVGILLIIYFGRILFR